MTGFRSIEENDLKVVCNRKCSERVGCSELLKERKVRSYDVSRFCIIRYMTLDEDKNCIFE